MITNFQMLSSKLMMMLLSVSSFGFAGVAFKLYLDLQVTSKLLEDSNTKIETLITLNKSLHEENLKISKNIELTSAKVDAIMYNVNAGSFTQLNNSTTTIMCVLAVGLLVIIGWYFTPSISGVEKIVKDSAIDIKETTIKGVEATVNSLEISDKIYAESTANMCESLAKLLDDTYKCIKANQFDSRDEILSLLQYHHNFVQDIALKIMNYGSNINTDTPTSPDIIHKVITNGDSSNPIISTAESIINTTDSVVSNVSSSSEIISNSFLTYSVQNSAFTRVIDASALLNDLANNATVPPL